MRESTSKRRTFTVIDAVFFVRQLGYSAAKPVLELVLCLGLDVRVCRIMKAVLARKATYDEKHYVNNRTWKIAKVVKGVRCTLWRAIKREREKEREREKKYEKYPFRGVSIRSQKPRKNADKK